jgi:hypothetical protein
MNECNNEITGWLTVWLKRSESVSVILRKKEQRDRKMVQV